jgi:hypothetical protein
LFLGYPLISEISRVGDILHVSQVDANVGYWQVTACFLILNYRRPDQAGGEEQTLVRGDCISKLTKTFYKDMR